MLNEVKRAYLDTKKIIEKVNKSTKDPKFLLVKSFEEVHEGNWILDETKGKSLLKHWKQAKDYDKKWDQDLKLLLDREFKLYISQKDLWVN